MIIEAKIISRPYAGEYTEKIYDIESPWNSQYWTFVKFTNDDFTEWCGQFRGSQKNVAISEKLNTVLILTSSYLFEIDLNTSLVKNAEDQPRYTDVTVSPNGDYILVDYYHIFKVSSSISQILNIQTPIDLDMIKIKGWENDRMIFSCDEFLNSNNTELEMYLDLNTLEIGTSHNPR